MKKKILLILPNLAGGGAEKVMVTLLRNFDREKADYFFLVIDKSGPYLNELPDDIHITDLNIKSRFFLRKDMLKVQKRLIQEINLIQPDAILTTLTEINITILSIRKYLKGNPKIVVRETNPPSPRWSGLRLKIIKYLYSKFYKKANNIIAISEAVKKDLSLFANLSEQQIDVIYNPLPIKEIQLKANKESGNNQLGDNDNNLNIVSIGRLTKQKDYPTLLKAIKIVNENYNVHLTILGEGNEYDSLIKMSKQLGISNIVNFAGFVDNPYSYLKNSDLFVLSSRWEGFGLVIVEALATGTPVIATDSNGAPAEILENGRYGILTRVGDEKMMANRIIKVLRGDNFFDENKLIHRAFDFDVGVIANKYLNFLIG